LGAHSRKHAGAVADYTNINAVNKRICLDGSANVLLINFHHSAFVIAAPRPQAVLVPSSQVLCRIVAIGIKHKLVGAVFGIAF
jgi:hypothetical protein